MLAAPCFGEASPRCSVIARAPTGSYSEVTLAPSVRVELTARLPSSDTHSGRLRRQASRDTAPELALRRALHQRGLRYRVDYPLPVPRRRGDVVFSGLHLAVFVDGCFWHGCPDHGRPARHNADWWRSKISDNRVRDADTSRRLEEMGWTVLRFWEHDNPFESASVVEAKVRALRAGRT